MTNCDKERKAGSDEVPEEFMPQRVWTDEEIKELKEKARLEGCTKLSQMLTEEYITNFLKITELDKERRFWKKFFLWSYAIFLLLEGLWIILYLLK